MIRPGAPGPLDKLYDGDNCDHSKSFGEINALYLVSRSCVKGFGAYLIVLVPMHGTALGRYTICIIMLDGLPNDGKRGEARR
jgi:hypothetical protein